MDTGKLVALLNLTTSDNDNEALSAIRHANAMMKKNNLQWADFIGKKISHTPPPKPPPSTSTTTGKWSGVRAPDGFNKDFVVEAYKSTKFHDFMAKKGPSTQKFMLSLHASFMRWNRLTDKQYEVFAKIWNEFVEEAI